MASLLMKIPPGSAFKKVSCISNNPARYAGQSHHIGRLSRAEARFLLMGGGGGIIRSTEGTSLVGELECIIPQKIFKFGGSETLFSALVMRYVSEESTLNMKMANNCRSL